MFYSNIFFILVTPHSWHIFNIPFPTAGYQMIAHLNQLFCGLVLKIITINIWIFKAWGLPFFVPIDIIDKKGRKSGNERISANKFVACPRTVISSSSSSPSPFSWLSRRKKRINEHKVNRRKAGEKKTRTRAPTKPVRFSSLFLLELQLSLLILSVSPCPPVSLSLSTPTLRLIKTPRGVRQL